MFKCQWCECELSEPEVYCPDCIEMLNDAMDLMLEGVARDTSETPEPEYNHERDCY